MDELVPRRMVLERVFAELDPCLINEGCIDSAEGYRWVLRFATKVKNIGQGRMGRLAMGLKGSLVPGSKFYCCTALHFV